MSALYARLLMIAGLTGLVVLGVSTASGAPGDGPKDGEALALIKKAIDTDYLGTKFADAEKKLNGALKLCGPAAACSAKVRAQVLVNLGIVYIGGMNRADDGKAQFVEALKQDPSVVPNPDLISPEIEAAFADAKRSAGTGRPAGPTQGPSTQPATPTPPVASAASSSKGDLVHTAPAEDATLTPLPLYAELPPGQTAARLQLSYKPFGATEWKSLAMKATDKGFSVEIPCAEIGSAAGDLAYFIQAFDGDNNLVSWSGSRTAPNKVAIRVTLEGEMPHLPGQPPPARCADIGDCPPEFPGCKGAKSDQPPCEPGADCTQAPPSEARKNWISLAFQMDLIALPSSTEACYGPPASNYTCFYNSGSMAGQYFSTYPYVGSGDMVQGGLGFGTLRILAGYDRAIGNFSVGARVGAAILGGGPSAGGKGFLPLHGEARAAYWFGKDPFERKGLRPYVVLGGGVAEVDGKVTSIVYVNQAAYENDVRTTMDAWQKAGTGFITAGAGVLLGVTPRTGPFLEVKYMQLLGASAPALSLQLGWALGL